MKTVKLIIAGIFFLFLSLGVFAQGPPPPPDDHGSEVDDEVGGGAPISGGVFMLLALGAGYGGKKIYDLKKKKKLVSEKNPEVSKLY